MTQKLVDDLATAVSRQPLYAEAQAKEIRDLRTTLADNSQATRELTERIIEALVRFDRRP